MKELNHFMPGSFVAIGHRGAMGYEPENTLRSIRKAIELQAPWVELDVYFVDGELVVIHDDTLERTTNGRGRVAEQSYNYLRSLDAGKGEQIPTLKEVFATVPNTIGINIELKGPGTAKPVYELLRPYLLNHGYRNILVSSFDHRMLQVMKDLDPNIALGALLVGLPVGNAKFASDLGAYSANISIEFIDKEFVDDAHRRGLKVLVFTVNEPQEIVRIKQLGVDGVFSNFPDRVI